MSKDTLVTNRDALRAKIFSEKVKHTVVLLDDGQSVEVRQSTVGQLLESIEKEDLQQRLIQMLIEACYVPGTDERVFDDADFDSLLAMPSGGVYQKLMDAVNEQLLEGSLKDAEKKGRGKTSTH